MNLTLRKVRAGVTSLLFFAAILALAVPAMAQTPPPCNDQSPRNLNMELSRTGPPKQGFDYNFVSGAELVTPVDADHVKYQRIVLELCDRHYHTPVENVQGCPGEKGHTSATAKKSGPVEPPAVGDWVEVHNVYAAAVDHTGDCSVGHDHNLACCAKPPFVVLGYVAEIEDQDKTPTGVNFAEWTGSATSEPATGCNTVPARWRFTLGCGTQLTLKTLETTVGGKPHSARPVQGPNLVSTDLTFVGPNYTTAVCRKVNSNQPIPDQTVANRACPGVCKWPLDAFNGTFSPNGGSGLCGCCPLERPQD